MYTLQGKPDQHVTHIPRSVHVWSQTIHISRGQYIAIFHVVINRFEHIHCSQEEWLLTQPIACMLTGLWVRTQFLSHNSQWSSEVNTSFCWQSATSLTGPISLTCDLYIQYLLATANPSALNQHRRGLQPWRCWCSTSHSSTFPTDGPPLPPKDHASSQVIQSQHKPLVKYDMKHLSSTRGLLITQRLPKSISTPSND
jgi:hypothetical protein